MPELSSRQASLCELIARGLTNREIAFNLDLTDGTVKQYLHEIFQIAGVRNRTGLAVWWRRHVKP